MFFIFCYQKSNSRTCICQANTVQLSYTPDTYFKENNVGFMSLFLVTGNRTHINFKHINDDSIMFLINTYTLRNNFIRWNVSISSKIGNFFVVKTFKLLSLVWIYCTSLFIDIVWCNDMPQLLPCFPVLSSLYPCQYWSSTRLLSTSWDHLYYIPYIRDIMWHLSLHCFHFLAMVKIPRRCTFLFIILLSFLLNT